MNGLNTKQKVFFTDMRGGNPALSSSLELISKYNLSSFQVVGAPEEADIVLYLENGYLGPSDLPRVLQRVRTAPKALHFVFSETDWPFPFLPGAYPSLSKPLPWALSWAYLQTVSAESNCNTRSNNHAEAEFLFSFLGRIATHPVRKKVQMLDKPSTPCLDIEGGPQRFPSFDYSTTYFDLIRRSKFVLCPRGFGVSSIRIFEAMARGRVPVVISDRWQPPPGMLWNEFCVLIRENEVASIPAILYSMEGDALLMGQRAFQIYNEYFAPNVFVDRLLLTLLSRFDGASFTTEEILWRAWRALGWRELRTLFHQARSAAFTLSGRQCEEA